MVSEAAEIPGNLLNVEPLQKVSGLLIVNWSYRNIPSGRGFRVFGGSRDQFIAYAFRLYLRPAESAMASVFGGGHIIRTEARHVCAGSLTPQTSWVWANIGALMITYTVLGFLFQDFRIMGPKTPFELLRPQH